MSDLERGVVRPASDDYAMYADEMRSRGKLLPCEGCGGAPDHTPNDARCAEERARQVRMEQIRLEHAQHLARTAEPAGDLTEQLRRLMVD